MIVLGLLAIGLAIGLITTRLLGQVGRDRLIGTGFGMFGALIGGSAFVYFTGANVPNAEFTCVVIATNSAVLLAMIYRALTMPTTRF